MNKIKSTAIIGFIATLFVAVACSGNGNEFVIRGSIENMEMGMLFIYNPDDPSSTFDTIYVQKGKFAYKKEIDASLNSDDDEQAFMLVFPNAIEQVVFAKAGKTVSYKASANNLTKYSADGCEANSLIAEFREKTEKFTPGAVSDMAAEFAQTNAKSVAAIYLLRQYVLTNPRATNKDISSLVEVLLKSHPHNAFLLALQSRLKAIKPSEVGNKFPKITILSLGNKKVKGTHTIGANPRAKQTAIVFWATWMPREYEFIDSLGMLRDWQPDSLDLAITALSLDTEVYRWQEMTREDTLSNVLHLCDANSWASPAVQTLNVTSIPTFLLVSKDGKIKARGTSMHDLLDKLK
ncbi:MAG: DUF4369 domain-containing protein [Bacteroidaceae bacterium]|nr:DUF4369 domain-containing protein [Bacteroidaceae bacterium]